MTITTSVPNNTHVIEVRDESYGYTLAHRLNGRVLYVATYQNNHDAMRQAKKLVEHEKADGHEVMFVVDPRIG